MSELEYHIEQLEVALDPSSPRRDLPTIPPACRSVLDVGCGAGQTLIACSFPPETALFGVDVDGAALRLGKSLDERIQFIQGAGASPPFAEASVDMVISRVALPYMNVRPALAGFYRILRPGGHLWVTLHGPRMVLGDLGREVRGVRVRATIYRSYVLANGILLHLTGRTLPFPGNIRRVESFQTRGGIRRALEGVGFRQLRMVIDGPRFTVGARKPEAPNGGKSI